MEAVPSIMVASLRAKFDVLLRRGFVRSVGVLVGGTAFAQALMVLVLPVLTRLYSPQDFSVFAVYASMLGIISVAACLRLEIAIPMPERDQDAANLLALALFFSAVVAALVAFIVLLFPTQVVHLLEQPAIAPYLWLLPLGIWLASSYSALQFWATRKKKFSSIAKTRMTQAIGGACTQVGFGWAGVAPFGLLLGHMISGGAGIFGLARDALKHERPALASTNLADMRRMLREYSRFPKYSAMEALANNAGIQLPVIIIAALAIGPEAGFLMLAVRAMQAPMGLVGGAVAQVYLSRAPQELREGTLGGFTAAVMAGLAKTGVGPLIFAGIVAPPAFALVFGEEWRRAGVLVAWMTPWFVFQFLASPISMVMHVRNWQRAMLALTVTGLIIRIGAMGLAARYDRAHFSEYYAVSGFVFYLVCCCIFSSAAGLAPTKVARIIKSAAVPLIIWVSLGIACRWTLEYLGL